MARSRMDNGWDEALATFGDMRAALIFLSRLPLPLPLPAAAQTPDFARSAGAFPLAGLLVGIVPALIYGGALGLGLGPLPCAVLTIGASVVTTGALHEDGLADVADGFWGGATRERKLAIMRDSAIGSYGTLALILSVSLRIALFSSIAASATFWQASAALLFAAAVSRGAILIPWHYLPPARHGAALPSEPDGKHPEGLSVRYGIPTRQALVRAAIFSGLICLAALFILGWLGTLAALIALAFTLLVVLSLARKHIGGQTGDVLGATQQMAEIGLYAGLAVTI